LPWFYGEKSPVLLLSFAPPGSNQIKRSGNDNFSLFWQNAPGITLPKKPEVRSIPGLPMHRLINYFDDKSSKMRNNRTAVETG
jgi:hypothetical protein